MSSGYKVMHEMVLAQRLTEPCRGRLYHERHACVASVLEQPIMGGDRTAPHQMVAALVAAGLGLRLFDFGSCGFATASCAFALSASHLGFVLLF